MNLDIQKAFTFLIVGIAFLIIAISLNSNLAGFAVLLCLLACLAFLFKRFVWPAKQQGDTPATTEGFFARPTTTAYFKVASFFASLLLGAVGCFYAYAYWDLVWTKSDTYLSRKIVGSWAMEKPSAKADHPCVFVFESDGGFQITDKQFVDLRGVWQISDKNLSIQMTGGGDALSKLVWLWRGDELGKNFAPSSVVFEGDTLIYEGTRFVRLGAK
jgi:hypothetical protein